MDLTAFFLGLEYGYKQCEKGHNIQKVMGDAHVFIDIYDKAKEAQTKQKQLNKRNTVLNPVFSMIAGGGDRVLYNKLTGVGNNKEEGQYADVLIAQVKLLSSQEYEELLDQLIDVNQYEAVAALVRFIK